MSSVKQFNGISQNKKGSPASSTKQARTSHKHQLQKQRYMKYYTSWNPFFQAVCAEKRKEDYKNGHFKRTLFRKNPAL